MHTEKHTIDPLFVVFLFFIIFIILVVIFLLVYNKTVFSPSKKIVDNHKNNEKRNYRNFFIGCDSSNSLEDKKNKGENNINVRLYNNYPGEKVVLFFHGNSGNVSHRSYIADICDKFNFNLLLVDYEGYGVSDGTPGVKKVIDNADLTYKFLSKYFKSDDIIVWGESLGGSAAIWVASRYKVRSLILLSTFTSISDVAKNKQGKLLSKIITASNKDLRSDEWAKNVMCPTLIVHSSEDTLIPYKLAILLYKNIGGKHKKMITIKGDHANPQIKEDQFDEIFAFLGIKKHKHNLKEISERIKNVARIEKWV